MAYVKNIILYYFSNYYKGEKKTATFEKVKEEFENLDDKEKSRISNEAKEEADKIKRAYEAAKASG